jgi:hypothetical protein
MLYYWTKLVRRQCREAKEVRAMKKHWLRGVLLGVSLALFLAGGVALAQGIVITTDPEECLECSTARVEAEYNWLAVYSSGWQDNETITFHAWYEDVYMGACTSCGQAVNGEYACPEFFVAFCPHGNNITQIDGAAFSEVDPSADGGLGNWEFSLVGDTSGREGSFSIVVAEDCLAYEFVPEAGTIALLGSGLAGLAGYATLRLRSKA